VFKSDKVNCRAGKFHKKLITLNGDVQVRCSVFMGLVLALFARQ
jgi:hypothetical protein